MSHSENPTRQFWLDTETTGLDPLYHSIIEIAATTTRVTDGQLAVEQSFDFVVRPEQEHWSAYCVKMHQESGLLEELSASYVVPLEFAVGQIVTALRAWCRPKEVCLAGRTVHFDRQFLRIYASELDAYLHHRHLDVSAIEMFLEQSGVQIKRPDVKAPHRARQDVDYAISQYRQFLALMNDAGVRGAAT